MDSLVFHPHRVRAAFYRHFVRHRTRAGEGDGRVDSAQSTGKMGRVSERNTSARYGELCDDPDGLVAEIQNRR